MEPRLPASDLDRILVDHIRDGRWKQARALLEAGANQNAQDPRGKSLPDLVLARQIHRPKDPPHGWELLEAFGVSVQDPSSLIVQATRSLVSLETIGFLARRCEKIPPEALVNCVASPEHMQCLLSFPVDLSVMPKSSTTAPMTVLMHAIQRANHKVVACVLQAGANPNQPCTRGSLPLEWTKEHATPAIVQMLLGHGASVKQTLARPGVSLAQWQPVLRPLLDEALARELSAEAAQSLEDQTPAAAIASSRRSL